MEKSDENGSLLKSSLSELVSLAGYNPKHVTNPFAWVGHIPFAYWLVSHLRPKVFVELGTHTGNSFFSFCDAIADNDTGTRAFAVDSWEGDPHAGSYGEEIFWEVQEKNLEYDSFSTLIRSSFDDAREFFEPETVDLLHIDGYHTYEAVKHDFEFWLPKLRKDATILFHDTAVMRGDFGVHKFWKEVKDEFPSIEFLHSNGLGVINLSPKDSWIPIEFHHQKDFLEYFSSLGASLIQNTNTQDKLRIEKETLKDQLVDAIRQIDELKASKSWILTKPLRYLLNNPLRKK
jgi:hypothetical protein